MYNFVRGREHPIIPILAGIPWIIFVWLSVVFEHVLAIQIIAGISMTLFFGYTTVSIFRHISETKEITSDTLFGAACIYLLLGLTWTGVYTLVEMVHPFSFQFSSDPSIPIVRVSTLIYYSFTTLTTLGYGDINPISPLAQTLAILEAMTGVLYMAVIIGMLVGIFSSSEQGKEAR
jgi:hypothetical protein